MNKRDEKRGGGERTQRLQCRFECRSNRANAHGSALYSCRGTSACTFASGKEAASSILTLQAGASGINQIYAFVISPLSLLSAPALFPSRLIRLWPPLAARVNIDGKEYLVCSAHTSIRCRPRWIFYRTGSEALEIKDKARISVYAW